jgi:hypothetical protein
MKSTSLRLVSMSLVGTLVLGSVSLGFLACKARKSQESEPDLFWQKPFALGEEREEPNEQTKIQTIVDISIELMKKHSKPGDITTRDVHSKSNGCVRGFFKVRSNLEDQFKTPLFTAGAQYPTWVRISNGAPGVGEDKERQTSRGFAMKLMQVPGNKLTKEEANTHDFLMVNGRRFFIRDLDTYIKFLRESNNERTLVSFLEINPLKWPQKTQELLALIERTRLKIANPVEVPYFSAVPYRLRDPNVATKYRMFPCTPQPEQVVPKDPDRNYLRTAMKNTLNKGAVCYNFELLLQQDPNKQPIENALVEWKEEDSKVVRVGQLILPQQDFDTDANNKMCESMSFHPWHAVEEHRPLGNMNRTRRVVYSELVKARKTENEKNGRTDPYIEPTPDAEFERLSKILSP